LASFFVGVIYGEVLMISESSIAALIEDAKQKGIELISEGEFVQVVNLFNKIDALSKWLESGMKDEPSEAASALLDDQSIIVNEELHTVHQECIELLESKKKYAEQLDQKEPGNLRARTKAWESVLECDPDNIDASDNLARIQALENQAEIHGRIQELKEPLKAFTKNLKDVEDARRMAHNLLAGNEIADPELVRDLKEAYDALDDLRNDILRASAGGASQERAERYDEAIQVYESVLNRGYEVIQDDTTGEYIDVVYALQRTREVYWKDLTERAGQRTIDAEKCLAEGYAEVAVEKLNEALALVDKIHQGGEEIRRQVREGYIRTEQAYNDKERAKLLVKLAKEESDQEKARSHLVEAKEIYPNYPDIDKRIKEKEQLVVANIIRLMKKDQSNARSTSNSAFYARDRAEAEAGFARARDLCHQALEHGSNFLLKNEAREVEEKNAKNLVEEINLKEEEYSKFWDQLENVDQSIAAKDACSAESMLKDLDSENPYVVSRIERVNQLKFENQLAIVDQAIEEKDVILGERLLDSLEVELLSRTETKYRIEKIIRLKDERDNIEIRSHNLLVNAEQAVVNEDYEAVVRLGIEAREVIVEIGGEWKIEYQDMLEQSLRILGKQRLEKIRKLIDELDFVSARNELESISKIITISGWHSSEITIEVNSVLDEVDLLRKALRDLSEAEVYITSKGVSKETDELIISVLELPYENTASLLLKEKARSLLADQARKRYQKRVADLRFEAKLFFWLCICTALFLIGVEVLAILSVSNVYVALAISLIPLITIIATKLVYDKIISTKGQTDIF